MSIPKGPDLTDEQRCAFFEMNDTRKFSRAELAERFHISVDHVTKLRREMMERGTHRRKKKGRTPPSPATADRAVEYLDAEEGNTLRECAGTLTAEGHEVSVSTLSRILRRKGHKKKVEYARPCLTDRMKRQRVDHANRMLGTGRLPGDVYMDEVCKGQKKLKRSRRWSARGVRRFKKQPYQWPVVENYVFVREDGKSTYFEQTCRKAVALKAVLQELIRSRYIKRGSRLIMDKAPAHTAALIRRFLDSKGVELIVLPGSSPDMMPVENMNRRLTEKLGDRRPANRDEYVRWIDEALDEICDVEDNTRHIAHVVENYSRVLRLDGDNKYAEA